MGKKQAAVYCWKYELEVSVQCLCAFPRGLASRAASFAVPVRLQAHTNHELDQKPVACLAAINGTLFDSA